MALDWTPLQKALASLSAAIRRSQANPADKEVRDAVILRFEYTFELAIKFLKRVLEIEATDRQRIDRLSYRDLLREALEKGVLSDFDLWVAFREQRNITSHTYDESKAESVYQTAVVFHPEADRLRLELAKRLSD
jgi:nucleotidyltransferase substrate binding protein (TIGR01987 family)